MRNALAAAVVAAIVAASTGTAATVVSWHDRAQDARIAKLVRHDAEQRETIRGLQVEVTALQSRVGRVQDTLTYVYGASVVCLRPAYQPMVIRPDGTLASPAANETPTARVALVAPGCWH